MTWLAGLETRARDTLPAPVFEYLAQGARDSVSALEAPWGWSERRFLPHVLKDVTAVDLTVPDAAWNPFNTDLSTSCGDSSSLSIREVLASGWGDTYQQFRAGQSFNLRGLPNGKYFVAVIANPENRLVEASKDNNVSLRKVFIGGTPGHRTVRAPQVGLVEEFSFFEK